MYGEYQANVNFTQNPDIPSTTMFTQSTTMSNSNHREVDVRPVIKTAYFYQDGDPNSQAVRMAIHPNRYRSLEALMGDLTEKMPRLSYGTRAIYTPRGKDKVRSLADLENQGHYICSERTIQPKYTVSSDRFVPVWRTGMTDYRKPPVPPTRSRTMQPMRNIVSPELCKATSMTSTPDTNGYSGAHRSLKTHPTVLPPLAKPTVPRLREFDSDYTSPQYTKQLSVHLDSRLGSQKTVVIRRRHVKTMGQVLQELSGLFQQPISKVCTMDGVSIRSVEDLIRGPDEVVAAGMPRYSPHLTPNLISTNIGTTQYRSRSQSRSRRLAPQLSSPTKFSKHSPTVRQDLSLGRVEPMNRRCYALITSAISHPDTGDPYLMACTANVLLTICSRFQTTQTSLLRTAYVTTLDDIANNLQDAPQIERGNSPNGVMKPDRTTMTGPFWAGRTDVFELMLCNMSEILKIRLSHDGTGAYPEWLPSEVRICPVSSLDRLAIGTDAPIGRGKIGNTQFSSDFPTVSANADMCFPFMRWLSRTKDDGSLTREVAAPGTQYIGFGAAGSSKSLALDPLRLAYHGDRLPIVLYQINVTTGNLWNAGTTALINVLLQGERGDSGLRALYNPMTSDQRNFSRGQTSTFFIEAVHLGRMRRLSIWLDGKEGQDEVAWYLDRIVVQESLIEAAVLGSSAGSSPRGVGSDSPAPRAAKVGTTLGLTCFPCCQWIETAAKLGEPNIQLTASQTYSSQMNDATLLDTSTKNEELWWQLAKWKFRSGTSLVFYSFTTGAALQVTESGRIEAQMRTEKLGNKNDTATVFTVTPLNSETKPNRILKPHTLPSKLQQRGVRTPLERDVEKINERLVFTPTTTRCFHSYLNPCMGLTLNETAGLCVKDERINSAGSMNSTVNFRVRALPEHWVVLEAIRRNNLEHYPMHVYVGPEGCVVSGAAGPVAVPGKWLMPYVKGTLRDQTILWFCTSAQQTLAPVLRGSQSTSESPLMESMREWNFHLTATGPRNKEAYWRVLRLDVGIRQFEVVAWPGHFLRVADGEVDIMGCGGVDCQFRIIRQRNRGFVQLFPLHDSKRCVGMMEDGEIALFDDTEVENCRFYPEVIIPGVPRTSMTQLSAMDSQADQMKSPIPIVEQKEAKKMKNLQSESLHTASDEVREMEDDGGNEEEAEDLPDSVVRTERDWKVSITTESVATNCSILLVVYDLKTNSGPILIGRSDDEKGLFRPESTDSFMIVLDNITTIYKIRFEITPLIQLEDTEWTPSEVILESYTTGAQRSFDFHNRPLGRNTGFCQLSREQIAEPCTLALNGSFGLNAIPGLVIYRVQLQLRSDIGWISGHTLFEPHISLVGKFGDSGRRLAPMISPTVMKQHTRDEQWVYETFIEAVYLGHLVRCLLGPVDVSAAVDEKRTGPMCTCVAVWDPVTERTYSFHANTWLMGERKGQIHELHLNPTEILTSEDADSPTAESDQYTEDEELMKVIYDDAHLLIDAIVGKAEQNLGVFEQWHSNSD